MSITTALIAAVLISACDFRPDELEPLAESITRGGAGDTTAWLLGGNVLVITIQNSPLYGQPQADLENTATAIAEQAVEFSPQPLESIAVSFYENEISDAAESVREFIFLVTDNQPVLQPELNFDATGPLTPGEIKTLYIDPLNDSLTQEQSECALSKSEKLADTAGDPEFLDPANVTFLSPVSWNELDAFGRRLILGQAIVTEAMFACLQNPDA